MFDPGTRVVVDVDDRVCRTGMVVKDYTETDDCILVVLDGETSEEEFLSQYVKELK